MKSYAELERESLQRLEQDYPSDRLLRRGNPRHARKLHRAAMRKLAELEVGQYAHSQLQTKLVRELEQEKTRIVGVGWSLILSAIISTLIQWIVMYLLDQFFAELADQNAYETDGKLEEVTEETVSHWMTGLNQLEK